MIGAFQTEQRLVRHDVHRPSVINPDDYEFFPMESEWSPMMTSGMMAYGISFRAEKRVVQPHSRRERSS